jgi:hypothetical protein
MVMLMHESIRRARQLLTNTEAQRKEFEDYAKKHADELTDNFIEQQRIKRRDFGGDTEPDLGLHYRRQDDATVPDDELTDEQKDALVNVCVLTRILNEVSGNIGASIGALQRGIEDTIASLSDRIDELESRIAELEAQVIERE